MNKQRRKDIDAIKARLEEVAETLQGIKDDIENVRDEEQDYFDNMPESFQGSEKGVAAQAAIDSLSDAYDQIEDFDTDSITSALETAAE